MEYLKYSHFPIKLSSQCQYKGFDANRALMSSNMQLQAVPLSRSEKCIVGTGLERQTALDSRVSVIAEREGKIISTNSHKVFL